MGVGGAYWLAAAEEVRGGPVTGGPANGDCTRGGAGPLGGGGGLALAPSP